LKEKNSITFFVLKYWKVCVKSQLDGMQINKSSRFQLYKIEYSLNLNQRYLHTVLTMINSL
jgi:hypothetical protein